MLRTTYILLAFLVIFSFSSNLMAVPAYPYPVTIEQPDGTSLTVILKGDEFHHYHTTSDGHLIVRDERGVFNYATISSDGKKVDTRVKARDTANRSTSEKQFIKTLNTTPSEDFIKINRQKQAQRMVSSGASTGRPSRFPRQGSPKSLVILVEFSDLSFVTSDPQKAFESLLNEKGYSTNGGTGSAKDYFRDNSMGTFDPDFIVVGPYKLPNSYTFYGENDADGDKNAVQMIVDACKAASDKGINFSEYDTDNDGIVDNVFVFYAGFNEAENAPANTVWPHRWGIYPTAIYRQGNYEGTVASVTFDGKRVEDYACTSELRGASGTQMTGIGTFTHEFGHVLGLADMYATNDAKHHTLSKWCIMDGGSYLNQGRTPPSYNAFERFQLGFHTPTLLTSAREQSLAPLSSSNQSYLISASDTHNLNPDNPLPAEFFLLENRQRIGWDSHLPGHGMLIYRIFYNKTDWEYNEPNNNPNRMGVDIIEADGIADDSTLNGDPFPGTKNVTTYIPALRNGSVLSDKTISNIQEIETSTQELGKFYNITFRFKEELRSANIEVVGNFTEFSAATDKPSESQKIIISGSYLEADVELSLNNNRYFEIREVNDSKWSKAIKLTPVDSILKPTEIEVHYAPTLTAFSSSSLNITSKAMQPVLFTLVGTTVPIATEASDINERSFIANWKPVENADGYYLTVNQLDSKGNEIPFIAAKSVMGTSDTLENLQPNKDYLYKVRAAKKGDSRNEILTGYSNTIKVHTLPLTSPKSLTVHSLGKGTLQVHVPKEQIGTSDINVFNIMGQKIKTIPANDGTVNINNLPQNVVLIIQLDKRRAKVIVN